MQFKTIFRALVLLIGLTVLMFSVMELIFAPLLLSSYYLPSLARAVSLGPNWPVIFFYFLLLVIELINFLAAFILFVNIFLTGYFDRYISYGRLTLISSALSLAIIVHDTVMNMSFYSECVERDIYTQAAKVGTVRCRRNQRCFETDIARWHQLIRCCGWDSPINLLGIDRSNQTNLLPYFCCAYDRSSNFNLLASKSISWGQNTMQCHLNSANRFNITCNNYRDKFFLMKSLTVFGHPVVLWYSLLKICFAFLYSWAQRRSLLPQSEGAFALRIPP